MSWARRSALFALAGLGLLSHVAGNSFREDELECEQAIAHLVDCCPDFPAGSVQCVYDEGCGTVTETALSVAESRCIERKSCDDVRASGLCEKVKGLPSPKYQEDGGARDPIQGIHAPVCQ